MNYIFWQNIISIHQSAFLKTLAKKHEVKLIVNKSIESERELQGWSVPNMGDVVLVINPNIHEIEDLVDQSAIHIFSGINVYQHVKQAIKIAVIKKCKLGIVLEPFRPDGIKGFIRNFKYIFLRIKYGKSIDFILATGEAACKEYCNVGFTEKSIFNWGYYVEKSSDFNSIHPSYSNKLPNILFVGSLDRRKNILQLIKSCINLANYFNELIIIGDGPLKNDVLLAISNYPFIRYLESLPNSEVKSIMTQSDILILPSIFDGWGAVVNEALHCGMQVIASENCGASDLLDGEWRGEKFYFKGKNDIESVLLKWLKKGVVTTERRQDIIEWSNKHISGEAAARYFEQIIEFVYCGASNKPTAPWKSE